MRTSDVERMNAKRRKNWQRMREEEPERWQRRVKKIDDRRKAMRDLVFVSDYEEAGMMHLLKGAVEL